MRPKHARPPLPGRLRRSMCARMTPTAQEAQDLQGVDVRGRLWDPKLQVELPLVFWVLQHNHRDWLAPLLEAGAPIDGRVPVRHGGASVEGRTIIDFVRYDEDLLALLRAGLSWYVATGPQPKDKPLHVAAAHGWAQSVDWLLHQKVEVDVRNGRGETALHVVASRGSDSERSLADRRHIVAALLAAGAAVDARRIDGQTPLLGAATKHAALIRPLLQAGADPEAMDQNHLHAMDILQARRGQGELSTDSLLGYIHFCSWCAKAPGAPPMRAMPGVFRAPERDFP